MFKSAPTKTIPLFSLTVFFAVILASSSQAAVGAMVGKGNKLFSKGNYKAALESYQKALEKDKESPLIHYNLGTALYKNNQFDEAVAHLQKGLLTEDKVLKKNIYFNLGNAYYKAGMEKEKSDLKEAIGELEQSLEQYNQILSTDKENKEVSHNYDFVKRELERLKEKQQQQKQQQKQGQQKEQNKDQASQQKDQSSEGKQSEEQKQQGQSAQSQDQKNQEQHNQQQQEQQASQQDSGEQKQGNKEEEQKQAEMSADKSSPADQLSSAKVVAGNPQQLTQKEAEMLIKQYQQNEEPKGLLNLYRGQGKEEAGYKDW